MPVVWKWSFAIITNKSNHVFFVPSKDERDYWVDSLHRLCDIQVKDPKFKAMNLEKRNPALQA